MILLLCLSFVLPAYYALTKLLFVVIQQTQVSTFLLALQLSIYQLAISDLSQIKYIEETQVLGTEPQYYQARFKDLWPQYNVYLARSRSFLWILIEDHTQETKRYRLLISAKTIE